ncbi:hypothetical protein [Flavilitoribacter nigricans]|uniref:hypothetical protein n=1 Tax=Flavilitoribacter nigricans TaxID=70997 RepID=UPI000C0395AF|nr:hypothetical protein [Flavilitoribacter nigricans]
MTEILKYTIKEKITEKVESTEPKLDKSAFVRSICSRLNISESQFRKIQNYKLGEVSEISAWQMKVIAESLDCAMEDLFTPIEEQQPEAA